MYPTNRRAAALHLEKLDAERIQRVVRRGTKWGDQARQNRVIGSSGDRLK